jgi:hypothetical protein
MEEVGHLVVDVDVAAAAAAEGESAVEPVDRVGSVLASSRTPDQNQYSSPTKTKTLKLMSSLFPSLFPAHDVCCSRFQLGEWMTRGCSWTYVSGQKSDVTLQQEAYQIAISPSSCRSALLVRVGFVLALALALVDRTASVAVVVVGDMLVAAGAVQASFG